MAGILDFITTPTSKAEDPLAAREKWLGLASIFQGMTMDPTAGQQGIQQQIQSIQQQRQADTGADKLTRQKRMAAKLFGAKLPNEVAMMMQDVISPAQLVEMSKGKTGSRQTATDAYGNLRYIDTGEVVEGFKVGGKGTYTEKQLGTVNALRDDLRADMKDFGLVQSGWEGINTFYTNPGAVSDYALAVGFAKILDPGSVAREGEVSAVANSGSLAGAVKENIINAIQGQGKLPPAVRQEIAELSHKLYTQKAKDAQGKLGRYEATSKRMGLNFEDIYYGSPAAIPDAVVPAVVPPALKQSGVTQIDWDKMTMDERKEFLK